MSTVEPPAPSWPPIWRPALISLATVLVYANSFQGVFLLDDFHSIVNSAEVHKPPPLDLNWWLSPRSVAVATFMLNYRFGGLDPWGYHAVNLLIHVTSALILFDLIRRTLLLPAGGERSPSSAANIALAAALIWAVHPLNTQAVTYIVQRMESLMAMFYLLALYGLCRGATGAQRNGRIAWYVVAVIAAMLSAASKQVAVTLPVLVLLYDRCLLSGSFRKAMSLRWGLYLAFAASWLLSFSTLRVLLATTEVAASPQAGGGVGFALEALTPADYARTQPEVMLHYLRLAAVPWPLCLDYFWPIQNDPAALAGAILMLALLIVGTVVALWRWPGVGFLAAAFFLILLPTSSVVPLADLAVEHRMYLPLAAVVLLAVLAVVAACRSWKTSPWVPTALATVTVAVFGTLTMLRNADYSSEIRMWQNVTAQRPDNARGFRLLGLAYAKAGRIDEALGALERATEVGTGPRFHENNALVADLAFDLGRFDLALKHYEKARFKSPADPQYRSQVLKTVQRLAVGGTLDMESRKDAVTAAFNMATHSDPQTRDPAAALQIAILNDRMATDAQKPKALQLLAFAYAASGQFPEAVKACREGIAKARALNRADVLIELEAQLRLYEAGKPFVRAPDPSK